MRKVTKEIGKGTKRARQIKFSKRERMNYM